MSPLRGVWELSLSFVHVHDVSVGLYIQLAFWDIAAAFEEVSNISSRDCNIAWDLDSRDFEKCLLLPPANHTAMALISGIGLNLEKVLNEHQEPVVFAILENVSAENIFFRVHYVSWVQAYI